MSLARRDRTSREVPRDDDEPAAPWLHRLGRLRAAYLAERVGVDAKTVERWITKGRLPHRAHRVAVADALALDEGYIWPEVVDLPVTQPASVAELVAMHPSRASIPHETWAQLMDGAREAIDILVYAGSFLFGQHDFIDVIRRKAANGVRVRILLGDENSNPVASRRGRGTTGGLQGRIHLHRRYLRDLDGVPGVEVRAHGTTLCNSLFRFDQDLLVDGHAWGAPAGQSPVLHLRRVPGGRTCDHYMRSFEACGIVESWRYDWLLQHLGRLKWCQSQPG